MLIVIRHTSWVCAPARAPERKAVCSQIGDQKRYFSAHTPCEAPSKRIHMAGERCTVQGVKGGAGRDGAPAVAPCNRK